MYLYDEDVMKCCKFLKQEFTGWQSPLPPDCVIEDTVRTIMKARVLFDDVRFRRMCDRAGKPYPNTNETEPMSIEKCDKAIREFDTDYKANRLVMGGV